LGLEISKEEGLALLAVLSRAGSYLTPHPTRGFQQEANAYNAPQNALHRQNPLKTKDTEAGCYATGRE
jgi:hypothetical protein